MSLYDTYRRGFRRLIGACSGMGLLLTRYHIFDNRFFGIYVHKLQQSDEERAQHDHPWTFISIILSRGYTEITPWFHNREGNYISDQSVKKFYRPGSILYRPAEYVHRLEMDGPVWTLVFRGPERRRWGFWPMNPVLGLHTWMDHEEYIQKFCE